MKIFTLVIIALLFSMSSSAQNKTPLDEQLSEMFKQNFSEWRAEDTDKAFYPVIRGGWKYNPELRKADKISGLQSIWTRDERNVTINISMETAEERGINVRMFLNRNVPVPTEKIGNLAEEAYLVQFRFRVEVAFIKGNTFTWVNLDILNWKESDNLYKAPQADIDTALRIARLVAERIEGEQSASTLTSVRSK